MDLKKKSPFKLSLTNNNSANSKFITFHGKQPMVKASTPLRHKKNQSFTPNNTAPMKIQQSANKDQLSPFHNHNFANFSENRKEGQSKKRDRMQILKQNVPVNSPVVYCKQMNANNYENGPKYSNQFNKHRIQTQPHLKVVENQIIQQTFSIRDKGALPQTKFIDFSRNETNNCINFSKKNKFSQYQPSNLRLKSIQSFQSSKAEEEQNIFQFPNKIKSEIIQNQRNKHRNNSKRAYNPSFICENKDGRVAKYRVISNELQQEDDLFYCSKCTIALVQQGFILEEIEDSFDITEMEKKIIRSRLQHQHDSLLQQIQDMRRKELLDFNQINKYYNQIIDAISQCQTKDIQLIQDFYEKKIQQMNQQRLSLQNALSSLEKQVYLQKSHIFQFSKLQEMHSNTHINVQIKNMDFLKKIILSQFIPKIEEITQHQQKFQKDSSNFQQSEKQQIEQYINQALRFSFQKKPNHFQRNLSVHSKKRNQLKEIEEDFDHQKTINQQCTAFRDLFPEQESQSFRKEISSPTFKNF